MYHEAFICACELAPLPSQVVFQIWFARICISTLERNKRFRVRANTRMRNLRPSILCVYINRRNTDLRISSLIAPRFELRIPDRTMQLQFTYSSLKLRLGTETMYKLVISSPQGAKVWDADLVCDCQEHWYCYYGRRAVICPPTPPTDKPR